MSARVSVRAPRAMAASTQPLATTAALHVLRESGNAADACIAMDAVLHVTEPTSTGLGGDMFCLYYNAATGQISALNGSGRAPAAMTPDLVREGGHTDIPPQHGMSVTVPGVVAAWFDLSGRHGTMPVPRLLESAIAVAEAGFEVQPIAAAMWERNLPQLLTPDELTIDGRAPAAGERFRNPLLGRVLRDIAEGGPDAFYRGPPSTRIAESVQRYGGVMTVDDLAAHRSTWEAPISIGYRGVQVVECPPNGQGLAALLALGILEGLESHPYPSAARWHLQIEALRLAFADARWYAADPAVSPAPLDGLLSSEYAASRRSLIDPRRATADVRRGAPVPSAGTVYHCAVDAHGNACSVVSSHYHAFGSGIVPRGLGFVLQNRGCGFSIESGHPSEVAPGKRPFHTIIPGLLLQSDGSLLGPFGVMGGFMQPQGHVQVVTALIDDGVDAQAALDRPRFCVEPERDGGRVHLEAGVPDDVARRLAGLGHDVVPDSPSYGRSLFGRGQVILRERDGTWIAGSDPRGDGLADGF
ncbi:MAG: gamma-glutamyltransferase family protein [Gemmatimonadaceae bacterium]